MADTYAYGILLNFMMTRQVLLQHPNWMDLNFICWHYAFMNQQQPFKDMAFGYAIMAACTRGERPKLPDDIGYDEHQCPTQIVCLIQRCWDPNPTKRPNFEDILYNLKLVEELLEEHKI